MISEQEFTALTPILLRRYAWDLRINEDMLTIPKELMAEIRTNCNIAFNKDFTYKGNIPYLTFANAQGIKKYIMSVDDDSLIALAGKAGIGKSTQAMIIAKYLDPKFTPDDIVFDMEQLKEVIKQASKDNREYKKLKAEGKEVNNKWSGRVIIIDEGVYTLFSGDAMSKKGKYLAKLFSIIRALGIIFIVCITNWRKISKGVKEDRFKCMFRIPVRGRIEFYSMSKISRIKFLPDKLIFPRPDFSEEIGYIDKKCQFWLDYDVKKSAAIEKGTYQGLEEPDTIVQETEEEKKKRFSR